MDRRFRVVTGFMLILQDGVRRDYARDEVVVNPDEVTRNDPVFRRMTEEVFEEGQEVTALDPTPTGTDEKPAEPDEKPVPRPRIK